MTKNLLVGFLQLRLIYLSYCKIDPEHAEKLQRQGIKCGISGNSKLVNQGEGSRIVNGEKTNAKKYPWLASVFKKTEDPSNPNGIAFDRSGATIISQRSILTCMHCVCNTVSKVTRSGKKLKTCLPQELCTELNSKPCLPMKPK